MIVKFSNNRSTNTSIRVTHLACAKAGVYFWQILDWYAFGVSVIFFGLLECVAFAYVYGVRRISDNIRQMTGKAPGLYWKACWLAFTPIILAVGMSAIIHQ